MAHDEIVLKIPIESNNLSCVNEHNEAAVNLNLASSQASKLKGSTTVHDAASRGQTHSRESSGASNLSVKFTIEREGVGGSSPSVTESVSVCSTPQHPSPNSHFGANPKGSKPPPVPCSTKVKNKRRRSRKSAGSSGQDSGALSGTNSANEDYINTNLSEDGSLEDEGTTDELSDEGNRLQQCHVNGPDSRHPEIQGSVHAPPASSNKSERDTTSFDRTTNTEMCINISNNNDEHVNNSSSILPVTVLSVIDSKEYGTRRNIRRCLHNGGKSTGQNEYEPASSTQNNSDVLDGPTSKYYRALSSVVSTPPGGNTGGDKSGHRRNISDAHQPLLSDNGSPSDSSCSEDDAGLNSSGYTRRKARTHRTPADHFSGRSGGAGDGIGLSHSRDRHGVGVTSHIIDVDGGRNNASDSDDEDHIPSELLKTLVAFIFLFMAWVATTTSLAVTHDRVPYQDEPLPDIFLDNVTYQHWGLDASEILIMVSTWSAFLVTIFHKHRFIVLRRLFLLVGIHYYYRSITMFMTVLPVADQHYLKNTCMPPSNQTTVLVVAQRVLKLLSGMGLSINGKHVYCGDYIYSGHTMTLIMGYFVIKEYSPRRWYLLHYASLVVSIAGIITLLLARGHYSIDVVIAYWITTRIWWMYHTIANNANLKEVDGCGENPNNFLKKMWWWYIFRYFECNVPVCLPRQFSWPIPNAFIRSKPVQYVYQKFRRRTERRSSSSETASGNVDSNLPTS